MFRKVYGYILAWLGIVPRYEQRLLVIILTFFYSISLSIFLVVRLAYVFGWFDTELNSRKYFPGSSQLLDAYGSVIFIGPSLVLLGMPLLLQLAIFWWIKAVSKLKRLIFVYIYALAMTSLGTMFFFMVYPGIISDYFYRFDPEQITEVKITLESSEKKCPPLIIKNRELIIDGFKNLPFAKSVKLSHESFYLGDGNIIELKIDSVKPYYQYLTVYKGTTGGRDIKTVLPQHTPQYLVSGGFDSPEFFTWMEKNVDTYFESCQK
jgi:hypothetical protein